jgi:DNA-binding NarL/FixJ family response regulator
VTGGQALTTARAGLDAGVMGLRVVFAEDNLLVRAGTAALLSEATDIEIVALVGNATELLTAVPEHGPDAVLTDIRMPPTWTSEPPRTDGCRWRSSSGSC